MEWVNVDEEAEKSYEYSKKTNFFHTYERKTFHTCFLIDKIEVDILRNVK